MILIYSIIFSFFFVLAHWLFTKLRCENNQIEIEGAIASEVAHEEIDMENPVKLQGNISINVDDQKFALGASYFPIVAVGNSMIEAGVDNGDLIIFRREININELTNGNLIAIRMPRNASTNAGKMKLRLFSHIAESENGSKVIHVEKFSKEDGSIIPSSNTHSLDSLCGVLEVSFNSQFTQRLIKKFSIR